MQQRAAEGDSWPARKEAHARGAEDPPSRPKPRRLQQRNRHTCNQSIRKMQHGTTSGCRLMASHTDGGAGHGPAPAWKQTRRHRSRRASRRRERAVTLRRRECVIVCVVGVCTLSGSHATAERADFEPAEVSKPPTSHRKSQQRTESAKFLQIE